MKSKWLNKPDPFDLALYGLVIAFLAGVVYFFQLRTMQQQLETMHFDQRPWVGVNTTFLAAFDSNKIRLDITLINTGKTPAFAPHQSVGFVLSRVYLKEPPPEEIAHIEKLLPNKRVTVLPPGGIFATWVGDSMPGASDEELGNAARLRESYDPIRSRLLILYVFGEYQYVDIDNRTHTSKFCIYVSNPDAKEMMSCEGFNEMD